MTALAVENVEWPVRRSQFCAVTGVDWVTLKTWNKRYRILESAQGGWRHYTRRDYDRVSTIRALVNEGYRLCVAVDRALERAQ